MMPRCIAPLDSPEDALEAHLCGAIATTEREVEGVRCPLCTVHAAELDADAERASQFGHDSTHQARSNRRT